jgi:hypothetical protein
MKKQIKLLIMRILVLFSFLNLVVSCGGEEQSLTVVSSKSELSNYIKEHNFYLESPLSENETYSFDESSFKLTLNDKRSGNSRTFIGSYETKSSKYSDKGTEFYYVKLIFNDKSYSDVSFFVFRDGNLIQPSNNGILDTFEDEYGLNIPEWHVSLGPDHNIYSPIEK